MVSWHTIPQAVLASVLLATAVLLHMVSHRPSAALRRTTSAYVVMAVTTLPAALGVAWVLDARTPSAAVFGARLLAAAFGPLCVSVLTLTQSLAGRTPWRRQSSFWVPVFAYAAVAMFTPTVVRRVAGGTDGFVLALEPWSFVPGALAPLMGAIVVATFVLALVNCFGRGAQASTRWVGASVAAWTAIELHNWLVALGVSHIPSIPGVGFALFTLATSHAVWRASKERAEEHETLDAALVAKTREADAAQAALIDAERQSSLGRIAASIAHEVNNPASFILANLDRLRDRVDADDSGASQALDDSRVGVRRIRAIVAALYALTRPRDAPVESVRLHRVVDACLLLAGPSVKHGIEIQRAHEANARIRMHVGPVMRIVLDLVGHAIDGVPASRPAHVVVRSRVDANAAVIEVHDDVPADGATAASPSQQMRLNVVHRTARDLGGTLEVTSRDARGCTRIARIPVELDRTAKRATPLVPDSDAPPSRKTVLLIDDEPAMLRVLGRLLQRSHRVFVARNATEARAIVGEHGDAIDTVLCDVILADTNGLVLRSELDALAPGLASRFAFVTGGGLPADLTAQLEMSGCRVFDKPVEPADLFRHIDGLSEGRPRGRDGSRTTAR